jgi:hypothetical protein
MPGNGNSFSLRHVEQLTKPVLGLHRGQRNHGIHLKKLANMDNIASLADPQLLGSAVRSLAKLIERAPAAHIC